MSTLSKDSLEIDIDGMVDNKGVQFIGKAYRQQDGTYTALADVGGRLCRVEVKITFPTQENVNE